MEQVPNPAKAGLCLQSEIPKWESFFEKNKIKNENLWYNKKLFGSYADTIISAGMAKNIIRENDYEKDTYCSYSYNYLLYGSCIIYLREI